MRMPWNVRVTGIQMLAGELAGAARWDYYRVEVRIGGRWFDAGTAKSWWMAFVMGLTA